MRFLSICTKEQGLVQISEVRVIVSFIGRQPSLHGFRLPFAEREEIRRGSGVH